MKPFKAPALHIPKLKPFKGGKPVHDTYPSEVKMENRRTSGVTRSLLKGYQSSPARLLPMSHGLSGLGNATKAKMPKGPKVF